MEDARRDDQAEIDAFLGASKAAALRDYQDTIPARQEMEQITRQLEGADANLSEDQQKRLLAALIEERKRVPMPQMSDNTTPEEYTKAYSDWQNDYNERIEAQGAQHPEHRSDDGLLRIPAVAEGDARPDGHASRDARLRAAAM
jgi:hypothetical protein